jgi:hypothetical protein
MANRWDLGLTNTPTFDINDNSTSDEQLAVFENNATTGITYQGFNGFISETLSVPDATVAVTNPGSLVIAPNQANTESIIGTTESQAIQLGSGANVWVDKSLGVINPGNELVPGGMGASPNILMNLPDSAGSYRGTPVWNYSAMEIVDALPAYQANRARLLDNFADIVESGEYDFFIEAFPINNINATLLWKDSHRGQFQVPPGSYLVAILADTISGSGPPSS